MSKINITKNYINYADIQSNDESGLLINGGTWNINRDGSANFTNIDGYIPNAGNIIEDDFELQRSSIILGTNEVSLTGASIEINDNIQLAAPYKGICLLGCDSYIRIDDFDWDEDAPYGVEIRSSGKFLVFGTNGKLEIEDDVNLNSEIDGSQIAHNIRLNSAKDIILNAAENQKVYYVHNSAEPTIDNEIATINSINSTVSSYIPNEGNNDNTLDFTLIRKSIALKSKNLITLSADTGGAYFSINPGQLDVNVGGAITLTAPGAIQFKSAASNGAVAGLWTQALQYTYGTTSFYVGSEHIVYSIGNSSSAPQLRMDHNEFTLKNLGGANVTISNSAYGTTSNNYSIILDDSRVLISSGTKSNNAYPNEFGFNSTIFYIKSENQTVLRSSNHEFLAQGYFNNNLVFKLQAAGALVYYIGSTQLLNINAGGFTIGNSRITDNLGDITLNAAENKKAYYVKNDTIPTDNDEIATIADVNTAISGSGYIPNVGNNDNTIDFTLIRKGLNLKAKTNITFGADTGDPYLSANPGNFNVSTSAITMSAGGPVTLVGNSITLRDTNSPASLVELSGGALRYHGSDGSLYVNNRIQFEANNGYWAFWGDKNEIIGNVINYCQSDTTFSASSEDVYDINLMNGYATISCGEAINGKKHRFGISGGIFQVYSSISNNGYGNITFGSPYFNVIYNENNTEKWFFKLNDIAFTINDKIKYSGGNIILNADENKKAYYVKNNATPTDNDEIATKGDIVAPDMSNYVLKTDFEDLLEKYNDLCERLNEFLEETGEN